MPGSEAPLFSVLLPTHNRADVVGAAIGALLEQSCKDFELLLVGDGCTDGTAEVVAGFKDDRIRWFDLPKAPHFGYANRNIALREAKGELIAFAAHDDLLLPDHLEVMARAMERPEAALAYSRPLWIRDDGVILPFFVNLKTPRAFNAFMAKVNTIPASCFVHRRSVFEEVGYWDESLSKLGDWDLWKRILRSAGRPGLVFQRAPTTLHFRATWRDVGEWGPTPLPYLSAMADARKHWPPGLSLPVENDAGPPQHQVADLLAAEPQRIAALRTGVLALEDEIAWEHCLDRAFR
ncbi:MAG: glycosyltransferase family A protein [Pseudomonadota bacterium]